MGTVRFIIIFNTTILNEKITVRIDYENNHFNF